MSKEVSLSEHTQTLFLAILLAGFALWIAKNRGFFQFPVRQKKIANIQLWEVLLIFGVFIFSMIFFPVLLSFIWFYYETGNFQEFIFSNLDHGWINTFSILLSCLTVLGISYVLHPSVQKQVWGPNAEKNRVIQDWLIGALTWFIAYPIVLAIGQIIAIILKITNAQLPHHDQVAVKYLKNTTESYALFVFMSLLLIFVVPIIEELLFRGFLQNWMKQKLGLWRGIFFTSVIFSFFHFSSSQGIDNIELVTALFVLSGFLGYIYERQESLWASIGLHSTFNGISVIAIMFSGE